MRFNSFVSFHSQVKCLTLDSRLTAVLLLYGINRLAEHQLLFQVPSDPKCEMISSHRAISPGIASNHFFFF